MWICQYYSKNKFEYYVNMDKVDATVSFILLVGNILPNCYLQDTSLWVDILSVIIAACDSSLIF